MKIGIDCRTILNPEKGEGSGIGHYTYQLVRHLLKIDKKNTYFLFFDRSVKKRKLIKFKQKNVFVRFFPFHQYKKLLPEKYIDYLVNATLTREKLDVLHLPSPYPPFLYKGPVVITVHDLVFYKFPELFSEENSYQFKRIIPEILKKAEKIIAVSKSTTKDLKELLFLKPSKIETIYHGVDQRFFTKRTKKEIDKIKKKYKIKGKYLFFVGNLEARKNILRVIESFERLKQGMGTRELQKKNKKQDFSKYQLVLSGPKGFGFEKIKDKISLSKYKKDIILTGYVPADDLGPLFSGAELFVFPSLYEGFGLPILEAMAKEVPIITSRSASMPEISSKSTLLVDPYNVAEITQAMYNLLTDTVLRKKIVDKGKKIVKNFSWEKTAKKTLSVYKKVLNKK